MPLPPGLNRAITDSTSPFGAYPPAEVLRSLEVYLADPRSTDAVYEGLVNRACAEPLSVPLVEKVVSLLKAYLLKYTPSQDLVHGLNDFTSRVYELPGLSPTGRKAVAYVRSCLRQLGGEKAGGARHVRGSSNSLGNASTGRSREDLPRLAANGLTADGRVTAMKVSVSSSALGRANDRYAAADALPSPTDTDLAAASGHALAWLRQSEGRSPLGYQDLRVPPAGSRTEPPWAVPSRPLQLPPAPPGVTAARARSWLQHLTDLAPRVTMAAPGTDGVGAAGGPPAMALTLSLSGSSAISLATIHRCVLDLEDQDIGRHIAEVLGEARAEAQQLQPATPQRRPRARGGGHGGGAGRDGGGARRSRPPRLLFHHPPYNRAEHLPISEADVCVVVEAVCGVRAASAMAAVMGPLAEREAAEAEGMWQAAFEEDGDFGQICGGILMKLLVDMWARSDPQDFFIVVLRMLCRALRSAQPSTRARTFDVLYNLYIHGAMLRTEAEEAALAVAAAALQSGAGGVQMPWQVCASAPVSPFISVGGGGGFGAHTPPPAPRGGAPPATPAAASTAEPQTPAPAAAAATAGTVKSAHPPHHLASHSLGLQNSTILDSGGDLNGLPSGQVGSRTASGAARPHHARRDTSDVVRLPPPPPSPPSPAASPGTQTAALGGAAGATAAGGRTDMAAGYDRWLRALLFRLLYELQQTLEDSEEVWRAAMGCLAQMGSHGGYWVTAWVQHLPPSALSCLLRAACNFNWSQELYAQLLKLVPCVLARPPEAAAAAAAAAAQPPRAAGATTTSPPSTSRPMDSAFTSPAAARSAAAAAADDAAAVAAAQGATEAEEMRRRLADFGGMDELLFHFARAPTPDARASLLTALVQCCVEPAGGPSSVPVPVAGSADQMHLQLHGARSPRSSTSPSSRAAIEGGPAGVLAVFQGLHLDSVCLALRAALQRPWQGMSSRLADVLASANLEHVAPAAANPMSPAASMSGSAEYALSAMHTLPAGVASPIAVRALLRPLLESLEACCADMMALPQAGELRTHMEVSVAHIAGNSSAGGPPADGASPAPVTASSVAAAWRAFKDICNLETWEARGVAVQWLHKLLSAACRACQGQILLLSPLTLKTSPEASRIAAATAPPSASAGSGAHPHPHSPRALWNTALADALLHVVREAPLGCELLMKALTRTAADIKAAAGSGPPGGDGSLSPRLAAAAAGVIPAPHAAAAAGPGVGGEEAALVACRRVMVLYYVGLQWMLQCGSAEARMPTVVELADAVLAGLLQPDPAAAAAAAAAAGPAADKVPPTSGGGARGVSRAPGAVGAAVNQAANQHQQPSSAQEPGGGMLISQQLLAGLLALDPDALTCTPPELLVTLLQQCSQSLHDAGARGGGGGAAGWSNGDARGERDSVEATARAAGEAGFRSTHRGFLGRPCAVAGAAPPPPGGANVDVSASGVSAGAGRSGTTSLRGSGGGVGGCAGDGALSGAAVGPWQDDWQDRRLALLLLLIARCSLDPEAFAKYSLSHVIKAQLGCDDLRCRYYAGVYLLKHWMLNQHDKYWRTLRHIIGTAQQLNDERLLDNPYLQMRTMLNVDHS